MIPIKVRVIEADELRLGQEVLAIFTTPNGHGFSQAYGFVTDLSDYGDIELGEHYSFEADDDTLLILLNEADEVE